MRHLRESIKPFAILLDNIKLEVFRFYGNHGAK